MELVIYFFGEMIARMGVGTLVNVFLGVYVDILVQPQENRVRSMFF